MKTLFRSSRRLLTLPVLAGFVAAGQLSADPPPPPMTVHLGDSGIATEIFSTHLNYSGVHNTLLSSFGRRQLINIAEEQPPLPSGAVLPHGTLRASAHSETNQEDYLYLNLIPSVNISALSVLQTSVDDDAFFPISDHPFNNVYFTTTEPLHYGIESEIAVTHTNGGSSADLGVELVLQDPGPEGGLARRLDFGNYYNLGHISGVLNGRADGGAVYAKVDAQGTADDRTEGTPNGILPPGHYSVTAALNFYFGNRFPNPAPGEPDFITGAMNLTSSGEVWVIIGKAAGWKKGVDGSYTASAPWIAQHEPLPDYHVFFKRPNAAYKVSGITGTVRSYTFAGGDQTVTLLGGSAEAEDEILVADDTVIMQGTMLTTQSVKIQDANAHVIVQNGSDLRADPAATGELLIGSETINARGRLTVEIGGHARAGFVTLGRFTGGGGGDVNVVSEAKDESRDAAVSEPPLSDGPVAAALTVNDTGAEIVGTVHVGSGAYASGAELAAEKQLHVLGITKLESVDAVVDKLPGNDSVMVRQATWTNSGTIAIGKDGNATMTVMNGGTLDSQVVNLGINAAASGELDLLGGSTCKLGTISVVGDHGVGKLMVLEGSSLDAIDLFVGQATGSQGEVLVSGGGSIVAGGIIVGSQGNGVLDVGGGDVASPVNIGLLGGGSGVVNVHSSSILNLGGTNSSVGTGGNGTLDISGGSTLEGSGSLVTIGGHGTVTLRGGGTTASSVGFNVRSGGLFEVRNGAQLNIGSALTCAQGSHVLFSESWGNVIGEFRSDTNDCQIKDSSTVTMTSGTITSSGELVVSGGGTIVTVTDEMSVAGALLVDQNAVFDATSAEVVLRQGARLLGVCCSTTPS